MSSDFWQKEVYMTKYHISMLTNKNVIGKQILDYIRQESGIVKFLYSLLAVNFFRHYFSTKCVYNIIFRHVILDKWNHNNQNTSMYYLELIMNVKYVEICTKSVQIRKCLSLLSLWNRQNVWSNIIRSVCVTIVSFPTIFE